VTIGRAAIPDASPIRVGRPATTAAIATGAATPTPTSAALGRRCRRRQRPGG
jgi:hypothetical protein